MLKRSLIWIFRHVIDIYFLSIESTGAPPSPDTGGRLFFSNHVNGLIDPLLVLTAAPCPISPVAKATLWNVPGLRWLLDAADAVPIVRRRDEPTKQAGANEGAFDRIASWLRDDGNILIFPEGTSHNEPYVLNVRSGAARMLVRAFRSGGADVTFQAVALEFDARDVFRSRCLIVYGPVRRVASVARDLEHDDDEALVASITGHVQDDLEELIVEGSTWSDHLLIARVAEMLAHDGGDASLAAWNEIGRQVEAARKALGELDEARVAKVAGAVDDYYRLLRREGLHDEQVAASARGHETKASWLTLILLLLALPVAAVGVLLFWLPYQAPRLVARSAAEPDVVSTYKLGTALVLFPLWALGLIAVAVVLLGPAWATVAGITAVSSPFAVLLFADRSRPLRRSLQMSQQKARLPPLLAARGRAMDVIRHTHSLLEQTRDLA